MHMIRNAFFIKMGKDQILSLVEGARNNIEAPSTVNIFLGSKTVLNVYAQGEITIP